MHINAIKTAFDSLIKHPEFQELVHEYRFRFGIPDSGFTDTTSEQYRNWIKEGLRKSDLLKDQFLFIAKRCRNLVPNRDPIPFVNLAYYFLYGVRPDLSSLQNDYIFTINPSGILGSFDITFTVPLIFGVDDLIGEFDKNKDEITKIAEEAKTTVAKLNGSNTELDPEFDSKQDLLATTPGNGADLVDKVHRDIVYLAEFGRVVLRGHLQSMKEADFVINSYDDKNKPMYAPIQHMGMWLLNRQLYPLVEEYWQQIDEEIQNFNRETGKRINRGIPLTNTGVAQISQGKTIEGLFNIYKGYEDDRECLQHLPGIIVNPEKDMANSALFTQFEDRLTARLFNIVISKYNGVFHKRLSKADLSAFVTSLESDKKLLFYMTLYRLSFSLSLDSELTTVISRSEIIRSLAELALWFEDEMKRKDTGLLGKTLGRILSQKVGQLNPSKGKFTEAKDLNELSTKITNAIADNTSLEVTNARIMTCLRNFAGHNLDVQNHTFFQACDEVFARMISFIVYSKDRGWI
jgi:hypothetical protein